MVYGPVKRDEVLPVFIGYDSREPEAYEVARASILKHATIAVHIQKLDERALRFAGLYRRRWTSIDGRQKVDSGDGKPFSTEFSFTRFLVPALCQWQGYALFMDCDQLFMTDIAQLLEEINPKTAIQVCKQEYHATADIKMDGQVQQTYFRKLWSAFMLFNCGHPSAKLLTVDSVNNEPGSWLHGFGWCPDNEIGSLRNQWNWIDGTTEGKPLNVHYTLGGPWFPHLRNADQPYFEEWRQEARRIGVLRKIGAAA